MADEPEVTAKMRGAAAFMVFGIVSVAGATAFRQGIDFQLAICIYVLQKVRIPS